VKSLLVLFYPAIARYFPNWSGWNYLTKLEAKRRKIFEKAILEHQQTLSEGPPRDIIDAYLQEIEKTTDPASLKFSTNQMKEVPKDIRIRPRPVRFLTRRRSMGCIGFEFIFRISKDLSCELFIYKTKLIEASR